VCLKFCSTCGACVKETLNAFLCTVNVWVVKIVNEYWATGCAASKNEMFVLVFCVTLITADHCLKSRTGKRSMLNMPEYDAFSDELFICCYLSMESYEPHSDLIPYLEEF
jgi:hypothetical protein